MASNTEGSLINNQIVRLAQAISSREMESIALGYLGIEDPIIKNLKHENRDNMEAFNREIILHWMNKNPEPNHVQVGRFNFSADMIKNNLLIKTQKPFVIQAEIQRSHQASLLPALSVSKFKRVSD